MIKFENVSKIYDPDIVVLENASFEIKDGEFVFIAGKSGAGKTTLVKLILGLEKPTEGQIYFNSENVADFNNKKWQETRRKISCIYQDYKLLENKTVYENIAYVMSVEGRDDQEIKEGVLKALNITGLTERKDRFPSKLSGGEQQRLAVARALVNNNQVIIADEPTGNLDPYNTHEVISLLLKINQIGKTVILSTHDKEIINKLGKRVITIDNGKIVRDEEKGQFVI